MQSRISCLRDLSTDGAGTFPSAMLAMLSLSSLTTISALQRQLGSARRTPQRSQSSDQAVLIPGSWSLLPCPQRTHIAAIRETSSVGCQGPSCAASRAGRSFRSCVTVPRLLIAAVSLYRNTTCKLFGRQDPSCTACRPKFSSGSRVTVASLLIVDGPIDHMYSCSRTSPPQPHGLVKNNACLSDLSALMPNG